MSTQLSALPVEQAGQAVDSAAPRPTGGVWRGLRQLAVLIWKYLVGVVLTMTPLTGLLIVGWTNRLAQRAVIRSWWRRSEARRQGISFADFVQSVGALEGHAKWPNWIVDQRALECLRGSEVQLKTGQRARQLLRGIAGSFWQNAKIGVQTAFNIWVFTLPGCFLWLVAWYFGWNNSFYKVYEEHYLGFATGLFGTVLFILAMLYVPLAQVRQAVTGSWRSFYEFGFVRRLIRQRPFACLGLAALYSVASVPVMVLKTAPYFIPAGQEDRFDAMSDAQIVQFLNTYYFSAGILIFPAYVLLRLAAAKVYATAVLREAQLGGEPALTGTEHESLARLNLLRAREPRARYLIVRAVGWTAGRAARTVALVLTLFVWFTFVAQIHVSEFLNYHPVVGWLNQPLVHLPWLRYIPEHLVQ